MDLGRVSPDLSWKMGKVFPNFNASQHFFSRQFSREDLFEGVREMLDSLRGAGYKLAVATGKKNAGLMEAMAATGMKGMFDTTRSADQTASKPNPKMINEIMAEMNAARERTLMVGDSVHDLEMAHNAGVAVVAVECGAHTGEVLKRHNPMHCLPHTGALADLIASPEPVKGPCQAINFLNIP